MGTNFYLKKRLSRVKKYEVINAIQKDHYEKALEILNNNSLNIHIGKRSSGWMFLWNANDFRYFKPTAESLKKWLMSGRIVDEYGNEFSYEEFIEDEIGDFLDNNLLDLERYYRIEEPNCMSFKLQESERQLYNENHSIMPNIYGEFYIPGDSITKYPLRFTTSTEFC